MGETFRGGPTCARVRFDGDAKGRLARVRSDGGEILFFGGGGVRGFPLAGRRLKVFKSRHFCVFTLRK